MLLAFIVVPLIQKELDVFREIVWNTHRIRVQKETHLPSGIPNHIYSFPEEYDLEECGMFFVLQEIKTAVNNMNNINSLGYVCGVHDNVNIW